MVRRAVAADGTARFWQKALASSRQLAFVMTGDRRLVAVSEGLCAALGVAPDELIGHTCASVFHGAAGRPATCPLHQLLLGGVQQTGEVHSEALGLDLLVTVTPIPDERGEATLTLHLATDVTERSRADHALRESEERFAALFENAPLGYQSLDEEGNFVEVNGVWTETLGYTRKEVTGRWFGDFLAPEYVEAFRERFPVFKERGSIHSEFEMLRKDGERRTIAFEGRIGRDSDGRFERTHCILSDITERVRAETGLRESEDRYRSLFEHSPVAMWEEDESAVKTYLEGLVADGVEDVEAYLREHPETYAHCLKLWRGIDANRAAVKLFGARDRDELLARNGELYRKTGDCGVARFWAAMLAGEPSATFEEVNVSLDGREVHVLETCTVVPGHEDTYDRVYVADVDITERKRMEEALRRSDETFADIAENVPLGFLEATLDGEIVYANPGLADMLSYDSPAELLATVNRSSIAEALCADADSFRRHVGAAVDLAGRWATSRERLLGKGGTVAEASLVCAVVRGRHGDDAHLVTFLHDETEELRSRRALEASERLLRESERLAHLGSWEWDVAADKVTCSAEWARLHGTAATTMTPGEMAHFIHPDDLPILREVMVNVHRDGRPFAVEVRIVRESDGVVRHVAISGDAVLREDGGVERVFGAALDVTERKETERALRASQTRYARAERVGHVGTWEYDVASERVWASPEARRLMGFEPSEKELHWEEVAAALSDPAPLEEAYRALIEEGEEFDVEFELVLRGGAEPRTVWTVATVERGADGAPVSVVGVIHDVTERSRAEQALKDAEARYRAMFEENRAVKLLIDAETGAIVDASPSAAAYYGYPRETLCTMQVADLNTDPAEKVREALRSIRQGEVGEFLFRHCLASGEVRDVAVISGPIQAGGRTLLYSIIQDVTEQRRAQLALAEREAQLEQAQRIARIGDYEIDFAAGTWTSSAALDEILGIDARYARDREGWFGLVHPDDRREAVRYFEESVARDRQPYDLEFRIVRPSDGEERWVRCLGSLEQGSRGELLRMIGVVQDVTERRRDREELLLGAERLRRTVDGAVQAMGQMVESRDPYTAGHERRVATLASAIAGRLGWSEAEIDEIATAALVHDIGKIAVPAEILSKPGKLSETEFGLVKAHPWTAHDILAPIAFTSDVAEIVLQHHERPDGSGYPRGLRDGEILPAARVLAVADVVEAMTTHRPYRPALPFEEAVAEIRDGLGVRYDEEAGRACLELLAEGFSLQGEE